MKITLDKTVITLSDAPKAEELRNEFNDYFKGDKTFIEALVNAAIRANINESEHGSYYDQKILDIESMVICKNHYELTIWITCTVKYNLKTIIEMSFDGMQALQYSEGEKVDAYIQIFKR